LREWTTDVAKLVLPDDSVHYLARPTPISLLSSGSTLFNCALGGGYPIGRIVNIVGDRSSAKSLCAIEACANFASKHPYGTIDYVETESAFDLGYAQELGLPIDRVTFVENITTVEEFFDALVKILGKRSHDEPGLVILDSYDALSDYAETQRGIADSSFGAAKAKKSSELFRRLAQRIESSKVLLMIISQVRDNIGVTFGRRYTRSGGRALDFYASQIIYLAHVKTLKRTVNKIVRPVGVIIRARVEKNKIAPPFREIEFQVRFGFGIDEIATCAVFLDQAGGLDDIDYFTRTKNLTSVLQKIDMLPDADYFTLEKIIRRATKKRWQEIEDTFAPVRRKYT
jgi:recombination protein RecA